MSTQDMNMNIALVVDTVDGKPGLFKECIPAPTPGPNQVLVKVSHVAQNPTDGRFIAQETAFPMPHLVV